MVNIYINHLHCMYIAYEMLSLWRTHSVEKWKIYSHRNFLSSNQLSSNFISKIIVFTKFLSKKCESKFPQFPQCGTFSFLNSNLRQNGRVFFQLKIQYNFLKMLTRWQCKYSKLFCLADSNKYVHFFGNSNKICMHMEKK